MKSCNIIKFLCSFVKTCILKIDFLIRQQNAATCEDFNSTTDDDQSVLDDGLEDQQRQRSCVDLMTQPMLQPPVQRPARSRWGVPSSTPAPPLRSVTMPTPPSAIVAPHSDSLLDSSDAKRMFDVDQSRKESEMVSEKLNTALFI